MKPDTETYSSSLRRKDTHTTTRFTNPRKPAGIFDRHRLVEVKETAVDVRKRMHFAAVCEIELQTKRRESRTVGSFAMKDVARRRRRARNNRSRCDCNRNDVECVLQGETIVRS